MGIRMFLRAYPWRRIDPIPFVPIRKPVSESRLALISSAGFATPDQPPFDDGIRGGDSSFRTIPNDIDLKSLINTHRSDSFDHEGLERDANLAFPLDRLRELCAAGRIGSLNARHLSFMGAITAPARLTRQTAPEAVSMLVADGVDLALLVPV
ncbi:MAG: selenoprotein B glycine/betaine/sarcosine/D-proline reductase [Myxococcales bacterium]|nr:selenoprotein B glycine/betaine/sarcosine/D-proline reductase [Myxococcales bacterium]